MAKQQVIVIHGGETFDTYGEYLSFLKSYEFDLDQFEEKGWKDFLQEDLGNDFRVIKPRMPSAYNAKYLEWKLWFEKLFPYIEDEVIIIGHSLGGIFVAKYLSEETFPKRIKATFLVAAPFDDKETNYSLVGFVLPKDLSLFEKQGGTIFIYHSKDDPVVLFSDAEKYKECISSAELAAFANKGHFLEPHFPELVNSIKEQI